MIVFDGLPALSAFRLERINREFHRLELRSKLVSAWNVYFVEAEPDAALDRERLCDVLRAYPGEPKPASLWTVPRLGTISPWSSKATDILRGCNFPVRRVEHGLAYVIEKLPEAESAGWQKLVVTLHDPMTQSVLSSLADAGSLFATNIAVWNGFTTCWFKEGLNDSTYIPAIKTSLGIAAEAAIIATILGLGAALALARMKRRWRIPFDILVYLTLVVPEIVIAVASLIFFVQARQNFAFFPELGRSTILLGQIVFNASTRSATCFQRSSNSTPW